MQKQDMIEYLNSTTTDDMLPLYIPSYNRDEKDFKIKDNILKSLDKENLERCYIVVREEQKNDYHNYHKELFDNGCNLLVIPEGTVTGLGTTRNFITEHAIKNGYNAIFNWDDDITNLGALFEGFDKKGQPSSKTFLKDERLGLFDSYLKRVIQAAGKTATDLFTKHPNVMAANIRKQRFSNGESNARIKYKINQGTTPRQTNIHNIALMKQTGIRIPMEYDVYGEDVGFSQTVLENGYSLGNITSFFYDYVPESKSSVIRDIDESKNKEIHEYEYKCFTKGEGANYLRVSKYYDDGTPMYCDIDFRKFNKFKETKPTVVSW